ncbi:MAG: hypothetical protein WCQ76_04470 [Fusobacterium sp.]
MKFNKVQMEELDKIIEKNPRGLNSPVDRMLGMGSLCNYFQIEDETGVCGYFSTNNKNIMLEFYLEDENIDDENKIIKVTVSDDYREKGVDKFIESSLKKMSFKE